MIYFFRAIPGPHGDIADNTSSSSDDWTNFLSYLCKKVTENMT